MKTLSSLVAFGAFSTLLLPPLAQADADKWTLAGSIGANFQSDADIDGPGTNAQAEFDTDIALTTTVGYDFMDYGPGVWRSEAEVFYRGSEVDGLDTGPGANGDVDTIGVMVNIAYEWDKIDWAVQPYLGVGIGISSVDMKLSSQALQLDDDDSVFSYQVFAGARYSVTSKRDVFADLRYLGSDDPGFDGTGGSFSSEYDTINASIGVRYRFG